MPRSARSRQLLGVSASVFSISATAPRSLSCSLRLWRPGRCSSRSSMSLRSCCLTFRFGDALTIDLNGISPLASYFFSSTSDWNCSSCGVRAVRRLVDDDVAIELGDVADHAGNALRQRRVLRHGHLHLLRIDVDANPSDISARRR